MTAVASPPSVQPLPRWEAGNNGGESYDAMSACIAPPRTKAPRPPPSTSTGTTTSTSSSTINGTNTSAIPPLLNGDRTLINGDRGGWEPRKKVAKFWPSKAEPVSGLSTARGQPLPTSSGQSAASTMSSALQQPSTGLLSQQAQPQQNGGRQEQAQSRGDSTAILALQPLTGTFERKQIVVPFFPDVQKIGRQTNQKTIPAANNGYFDSKVLSRQHAEIWADRNGKIWIRDVKSSNGTFVNGQRLSQENKESDPHELRESDTLELGIDIVSEDQKSIVHHKVSAKVELAGMYSNGPQLLDMIHIDPGNGQPMLTDPTAQHLAQMRGRGGSQASNGSNGRISGAPGMAGSSAHLLGARQMNMWMGPITIEQVVKKLTTELKQAKQQSHDLHRTSDFFTALLNLEPGEEPPKSPPKHHPASEQAQQNGPSPALPADMLSPFSQPPAPPPSQPLPEKPDMVRFGMADSLMQSGLKRTETERPPSQHSPTRPETQNGQIMSLVEALKVAKQEITSQGDRMKHLESALERERKAREIAERRAQALAGNRSTNEDHVNGAVDEEAFEPPLDQVKDMEQDLPNGHVEHSEDDNPRLLTTTPSMETLRDSDNISQSTEKEAPSASSLEDRYELLKQGLDQMKVYMESYKRRAEEAEESQRKFAEMVENIRTRQRATSTTSVNSTDSDLIRSDIADDGISSQGSTCNQDRANHGLWVSPKQKGLSNGTTSTAAQKLQQGLEKTMSQALQQQHGKKSGGDKFVQSAPYVSMVGVVLIGVGIMTWLNGWQPTGGGKVIE